MIKNFLRYTAGISGKYIAPVTKRLDKSFTVFAFHNVSDEPAPFSRENDICVSLELFKRQMRFVSENFNVISAESWLKDDLPTRAALITFDDGYQGIFKNALPILEELGLPSLILMNMGAVIADVYWTEQVIYMCRNVKPFQEFLVDREVASVGNEEQAYREVSPEILESYQRQQGVDDLPDVL